MSRVYRHVVIDGIDLQVDYFSTSLVTYSHEIIQQYVAQGKPNVKVTIRSDDMEFKAQIDGMEIKGDTVYVYGPFRKMFPMLFTNKVLLPWQEAYLRARDNFIELDMYRHWRDDPLFTDVYAKWFERGYNAATTQKATL